MHSGQLWDNLKLDLSKQIKHETIYCSCRVVTAVVSVGIIEKQNTSSEKWIQCEKIKWRVYQKVLRWWSTCHFFEENILKKP